MITALAASFGAPFWFDTLNKFIDIRGVGRAPEEKDPTAPKKKATGKESYTVAASTNQSEQIMMLKDSAVVGMQSRPTKGSQRAR